MELNLIQTRLSTGVGKNVMTDKRTYNIPASGQIRRWTCVYAANSVLKYLCSITVVQCLITNKENTKTRYRTTNKENTVQYCTTSQSSLTTHEELGHADIRPHPHSGDFQSPWEMKYGKSTYRCFFFFSKSKQPVSTEPGVKKMKEKGE